MDYDLDRLVDSPEKGHHDCTARAINSLAMLDRKGVGTSELHCLWMQLFHSARDEKERAASGSVNPDSCRGWWSSR